MATRGSDELITLATAHYYSYITRLETALHRAGATPQPQLSLSREITLE